MQGQLNTVVDLRATLGSEDGFLLSSASQLGRAQGLRKPGDEEIIS